MQMRDLINIVEDEPTPEDERIAAIAQLLIDKTDGQNTASKLNTEAFINIINKMGMPMTVDVLMDMVETGDLKNIISDVNQDEVMFKGKGDVDVNAAMTVDKARDTVDKMAKRQAKKGIHK
jgi:hypothetical protein